MLCAELLGLPDGSGVQGMPDPLASPYVFVSYTSAERERALALADALEGAGIRVWVDRRNLVGGSSWNASIVDANGDSQFLPAIAR